MHGESFACLIDNYISNNDDDCMSRKIEGGRSFSSRIVDHFSAKQKVIVI